MANCLGCHVPVELDCPLVSIVLRPNARLMCKSAIICKLCSACRAETDSLPAGDVDLTFYLNDCPSFLGSRPFLSYIHRHRQSLLSIH